MVMHTLMELYVMHTWRRSCRCTHTGEWF